VPLECRGQRGDGGGFSDHVQVQVGNLWVRHARLQAVLISGGDRRS